MPEPTTSLPLEAQHTPGPWRVTATPDVNEGSPSPAFEISADVSGHWLAYVQEHVGSSGSGAANAKLICAAPALLEALRKVTQSIRDFEEIYPQLGSLGLSTRIEFLAAEEAICEAEGKI